MRPKKALSLPPSLPSGTVSLGSLWDPVPHSQEDLQQPGASSSKAVQTSACLGFSLLITQQGPVDTLKFLSGCSSFCPQIRNVGTGLCTDTKHGTSGLPLRLETCIRGRGEAAWNSMQVRATQGTPRSSHLEKRDSCQPADESQSTRGKQKGIPASDRYHCSSGLSY